MAGGYLKGVGARLASLGKAAVNAAIPAVVSASINSAYERIAETLRRLYAKTVRNAAITFALNAAGTMALIFRPFGKGASAWIGMAFFSASFAFWLVRVILYCKDYGKTTLALCRNILSKRSLSKGISAFIANEYPAVALAYAGIDVAAAHFSAMKEIPRLHELVRLFMRHFRKRIALFFCMMVLYTVSVHWVLKPIILRMYW